MNGSPKKFGFKTKEMFLETVLQYNVYKVSITNCNYLITDDLSSNSIKMKIAKNKSCNILTYGEFLNIFKIQLRNKKIGELKKKMLIQ